MGAVVVTRAKRRVVGAHYGTAQWLRQRLTAVIMAVYTVLAIVALLILHPENHAEWRALFSSGWVRGVTLACFLSRWGTPWVCILELPIGSAREPRIRPAR